MEQSMCAIVLMSWAHLCQACSIVEGPSMLVAIYNQPTNIAYHVNIQNSVQSVTSWIVLTDGHEERLNEKSTHLTEGTSTYDITHSIRPTKSGTYKWQLSCGNETASNKGTYLYVRDSGFVEPVTVAGRLQSGLIALLLLLLLLSISGTYLVLPFHWNKQRRPSMSPRAPSVTTAQPMTPRPAEETSGSVYTSLQPRSDDVYDVLDEDRKTNVKLHAEVHGVPTRSPRKKSKPQAASAPAQDKPQATPDKPQIKPKPKKASADNSLYENIKR